MLPFTKFSSINLTAGVEKFIIFTDAENKSAKYVPLDSDSFTPLTLFKHPENQQPVALDYDYVEDRVYWSDISQLKIWRMAGKFISKQSLEKKPTQFYKISLLNWLPQ